MKKYLFSLVILSFVFAGCGSTTSYKVGNTKYTIAKDKVVETSYGSKKYAKYFYKKPHVKNNKNIYVIGAVDVPGDSSPTRCEMAADLQAKLELAGELKSRFENQLQYASEGLSIDQQSLKQIAMQSTNVESLHGIFIDTRFWEKKIVRNGPDTYVKYTCYSRAVMPMQSFEEQADKMMKEEEAKKALTAEFQKKVDESWDQFFKPVDVDDNKEYSIEYLDTVQ